MVIGDVAGHGLEAALVMSSVRKVLSCFGTLSNPDELIRQMNYWLCDNSERMVTIFCGLYDPASRVLTYASAGHPKPLLVTPAGPRFLENGNLPMGIFEEIDIDTYTVFIPNDTLLVLYTDGLIEANRNIIEGLDKLTNEAQKIPSSVTNQAHYLVRKILSSSSFEDDVACITFHFDKPIKSRWLTSRWNGKINY
jgi:serine phosphatase RsbU (regulator of sigma subunit)